MQRLESAGRPAAGNATGCAGRPLQPDWDPIRDRLARAGEAPTQVKACCARCKTMRVVTSLWRGGMHAYERKDTVLAETMQRQALEMLGTVGGMAVVEARIRNNLGVILSTTNRRSAAEQEFSLALRLLEGRVDPATRFHQVIANNHAQTLNPESLQDGPARRAAVQ